MKWIGLTGGLGSGKSSVTKLLRTKGWPVIDADQIAHQVLEPGTEGLTKVLQEFGADLLEGNRLNRRQLAVRVFGDPAKLRKLELIVHPLIQNEVQRQKQSFQQAGFQKVFYDVPLLYERNLTGFDAVIVVTAQDHLIRERLKKRNGWSDQEIDSRLSSQLPLSEKARQAHHVIRNDGGFHELEAEVDRVLQLI